MAQSGDAVDGGLSGQMCRLEQVVSQIQSSVSAQMDLLQALQSQMGSNFTNFTLILTELQNSSAIRRPSILKKTLREEEQNEQVQIPVPDPKKLQPLIILPGELKEEPLQEQSESHGFSSRYRTSSGRDHKHAVTVEELSGLMARQLLRGRTTSLRDSFHDLAAELSGEIPAEPVRSRPSSKDAVLSKTHRLSLDELRNNYNAQVSAALGSRTPTSPGYGEVPSAEFQGGLPCGARAWLVAAGIVRSWYDLWRWCLLVLFFVGGLVLPVWFGAVGLDGTDVAVTTTCFMASVAMSVWMLGDVEDLISDHEHGLDLYARNAGFINEWRRKSGRRLLEASTCLVFMCLSRGLVFLQITISPEDLVLSLSFCLASMIFTGVVYFELHVLSGLELAIDSFSVNFFRAMDVKEALAEWNVLQAMLRHVSAKLSRSLLLLGCASGASLLYLIEVSFVRSDVDVPSGFGFIIQYFWSLPPIAAFLYTLMRAAAVTEKASRVAPLVNSWQFENTGSGPSLPAWMDLERQYVVQYIVQSEAGFYIQGVRLRIFQVSKMCYYLCALLFATASQVLAN